MRLPRGEMVRSRVVADPAAALTAALDRGLTGYAVLEPQETLLLDGDAQGVLTFEDGVPVLAYDAAADRGGPDALAGLATPGPLNVELYELPADALAEAHDTPELRVPPGMPAEEVANAPELAERTRERAPDDRRGDAADAPGAVEAFLADEERVAAIRERARAEAERRVADWGLDGALADRSGRTVAGDSDGDGDGDGDGDKEDGDETGDGDAASLRQRAPREADRPPK